MAEALRQPRRGRSGPAHRAARAARRRHVPTIGPRQVLLPTPDSAGGLDRGVLGLGLEGRPPGAAHPLLEKLGASRHAAGGPDHSEVRAAVAASLDDDGGAWDDQDGLDAEELADTVLGWPWRRAWRPATSRGWCSGQLSAGHPHGWPIWQLEQAGTHASSFPKKLVVYPDLLEAAGYHVGYTGKGWGPGNFKAGGRDRNPAGPPTISKRSSAKLPGNHRRRLRGKLRPLPERATQGATLLFLVRRTGPIAPMKRGRASRRKRSLKTSTFLRSCPTLRKCAPTCSITRSRSSGSTVSCREMLAILESARSLRTRSSSWRATTACPSPGRRRNLY